MLKIAIILLGAVVEVVTILAEEEAKKGNNK